MFIYMMLHVRRKAQIDALYQEFLRRFGGSIRDCRLRDTGSRSLDLVFKADEVQQVISFAQDDANA